MMPADSRLLQVLLRARRLAQGSERITACSKRLSSTTAIPTITQKTRSSPAFSSLAVAEDNYNDAGAWRRTDSDVNGLKKIEIHRSALPSTKKAHQHTAATTTKSKEKHCETCTCSNHEDQLPPPLPEPMYSVRRRVMPEALIPLNSSQGRQWLIESLTLKTAASYIPLTEHFCNQSDPAFCGVTTLLMSLNALSVDPNMRWKGGWRYFGSEEVLLAACCIEAEVIRRVGITMDQFRYLAACQGLRITMKRAAAAEDAREQGMEDFRRDLLTVLQETEDSDNADHSPGIVVVSFSRDALGQTGDGHYSTIAAYHVETDQVLVLDVARFKYQPYWVKVKDLYTAMCPLDSVTLQPRGWYVLYPPAVSASYKGVRITTEEIRPAELVPKVGEVSLCPIHPIKIDFCKAKPKST